MGRPANPLAGRPALFGRSAESLAPLLAGLIIYERVAPLAGSVTT